MRGFYYKTLERNEASGMTHFLFVPDEPVEYVKNGLVECIGKIGLYAYKSPMKLEGSFQSNGVFMVSGDRIPYDTETDIHNLLDYVSEHALNETQKKKLLTYGNIFDIIDLQVLANAGIEKKTAIKIYKKTRFLIEQEEITKKLLHYGIPIDRMQILLKKSSTIKELESNLYLNFLYADIDIYRADEYAAEELKIHAYAPQRLVGFVYDTLLISKRAGNTCITPERIIRIANLRLQKSIYPDTKINMAILNLLLAEMQNTLSIHFVDEKPYIYENKLWEEETNAVSDIQRMLSNPKTFPMNGNIKEIEKSLNIQYTEGQLSCFEALKKSGLKIITGPPGSGKTSVVKGLLQWFRQTRKGRIRLAATTGRASQVLGQACGCNTETVNKMLNIIPYEDTFYSKTINNPIDAELIIVDEASMLGLSLASALFAAVKTGAILILVGDKDQLPSVEYGNVFSELIDSELIEVYRLNEVKRQGGLILQNAQRINHGYLQLDTGPEFKILKCRDEVEVNALLQHNIADLEHAQVLSTIKKTKAGTFFLNQLLQDTSREKLLSYGHTNYYRGDRVIMLKTDYDRGYMNGDIGIIIGREEDSLIVNFADKQLLLDRKDFYYMSLAYCITTHKAQGSEFEDVHIVLPENSENMLTRRILYTAVTRAKKSIVIYAIGNALQTAIENRNEVKRNSLLTLRLKKTSEN